MNDSLGRFHEMTGQQQALYQALFKKDANLSNMYFGALIVLSDGNNPDSLALAAHDLRELMEKLPRVLDVPMKVSQENLKEKVLGVKSHWEQAITQSGCYKNGTWTGAVDKHLGKLLIRLGEFFEWFHEHYPRRREEVSTVLARMDPSRRPLPLPLNRLNVDFWFEIRDFFVKIAHHQSQSSKEEFQKWLDAFEGFLLDRLYPRTFEDLNMVDEILREADGNA